MLIQFLPRYYDADKDAGGDGSDAEQDGKVKASDILNRYGKNEEAALRLAELYADAQNTLYRLRRTRDTLTRERDDLKAKLPADGAVVLAQADAAELDAYRALGKPAEVKTALDAKSTAEKDLATLRRHEAVRAAAEAHGYKAGLLGKVPSLAEQTIEIKDVQEDGKPVKRAFVGDTPLPDYIQANDPDFVEALPAKQDVTPKTYDINAGTRSNGNATAITDEERKAAQRRYSATF
jgi:hypothetical protein